MNSHDCPGLCGRQVPRHLLACGNCWRGLPREIRDHVTAAYRNRHTEPAGHRAALVEALRWYQTRARSFAG